MSRTPTLREIADKACIFDREHFDDGNEPAADTMLRHHETLKTDRKLITRLVPRFAVMLGYFEGYSRAVEDLRLAYDENECAVDINVAMPSIVARAEDRIKRSPLMFEIDLIKELTQTIRNLHERIEQRDIGIVIKPPPPPPLAAPPIAPNELSTEIGDELAQMAAEYANSFLQLAPNEDDFRNAKSACSDSAMELKTRLEDHWAFGVNGFVKGALWQRAQIENAQAGEDPPNVHELQAEIERLRVEWSNAINDKHVAEERAYALETQREPTSSPLVLLDDERKFWDDAVLMLARKGDTTAQSVASAADEFVEQRRARRVKESSVQIDEQKISIDHRAPSDELLLRAVRHADAMFELSASCGDLASARNAVNGGVAISIGWTHAVRSYVAGALVK